VLSGSAAGEGQRWTDVCNAVMSWFRRYMERKSEKIVASYLSVWREVGGDVC